MPPEHQSWNFYLSPATAWEAMLDACESARTSIDCEQYIFEPDAIGERFAEVFMRKARDGVRVRLLVDGIGSYAFVGASLAKRLTDAGVEIRFYNVIRPHQIHRLVSWFLRDHRKILVIDGGRAFTGGVCIASRMRAWRDTHVAVIEPLASEVHASFETMWRIASHARHKHFRRTLSVLEPFYLLNNSPRPRHRHIYHALLNATKAARRYAYFSTPYFIPSFRMTHALLAACRRGVAVRLMLPATSDVRLADYGRGIFITRLLKAGAQVYFYKKSMFHAKTVVVDDAWTSVGSANLDNLSLLLNYELNLVSRDPGCAAEVKQQFENDMKDAEEITLATWNARPLALKLLSLIVWPLRGIL